MTSRIVLIVAAVAAAIGQGCATSKQTEKEKLHNSYGILYPVTKLGEGISSIGNGFQTVSQPRSWAVTRPDELAGTPIPEQDDFLDSISVRMDLREPQPQYNYAAAGSYVFGPQSET